VWAVWAAQQHWGVFGGSGDSGAMGLAKRFEAHDVERIQKPWTDTATKGAPLTAYGGGRLSVNEEVQARAGLAIQSLANIASQVRWV